MDGKWDLSFLYEGFEDDAFLRDMAALPEAIRAQRDILEDKSLDDLARLEKLVQASEGLSALADRLGSFIFSPRQWMRTMTAPTCTATSFPSS